MKIPLKIKLLGMFNGVKLKKCCILLLNQHNVNGDLFKPKTCHMYNIPTNTLFNLTSNFL